MKTGFQALNPLRFDHNKKTWYFSKTIVHLLFWSAVLILSTKFFIRRFKRKLLINVPIPSFLV